MKIGTFYIGKSKVVITGDESKGELEKKFKAHPKLEAIVTEKPKKSDNNTKESSTDNKSKSKSNESSK